MKSPRLLHTTLIGFGLLICIFSAQSAWKTYKQYDKLKRVGHFSEATRWIKIARQHTRAMPSTSLQKGIDEVFAKHQKDGLHWIYIERLKPPPQGVVSAHAGQPTKPISFIEDLEQRGIQVLPNGRVAYVQPTVPQRHTKRFIEQGKKFDKMLKKKFGNKPFKRRGGKPVLGVEFTPQQTNAMIRRAQLQLALSILAGILVMLFCFGLVWLLNQREKLRQQEQQQRLYTALGDLSTAISHELQHPLQSTLEHIQQLRSELDQPRMHKRAGRLSNEVHRLIEITQSLIEFVDSGRINPKPHTISDALKTLQARIEGTTIHWPQHTSKQAIHIDLVMFERALSNIIRNAQQIAPDKAIKITSSIEDNHWHLNIRDHGPGFPDAFDPFEPFASKRRGGHGLGLAMTSEIIAAHGGFIAAHNHAKQGALFTIKLPLQ